MSFRKRVTLAVGIVVALIVLVGWELYAGSRQALQHFGPGFLVHSTWDPVADKYGALPFIFGTLVSSLIALFIVVRQINRLTTPKLIEKPGDPPPPENILLLREIRDSLRRAPL